jgi:hypothetical protein
MIKMFRIEGELLHQLNNSSEQEKYIIEVGNKKFKFTRIQIALLSPIAFKHFLHHYNLLELKILQK